MKKLLLLLMVLAPIAEARSWKHLKLVELDEVSVEAYDIISKRDHFFPDMDHEDWGSGANFYIKNRFLEYMFWNNRLHLSSDQTQIRHVGWEFDAGFHIIPDILDIYYYHHSEHVTEDAPSEVFSGQRRQFPVQDYYGIRVYLYKK